MVAVVAAMNKIDFWSLPTNSSSSSSSRCPAGSRSQGTDARVGSKQSFNKTKRWLMRICSRKCVAKENNNKHVVWVSLVSLHREKSASQIRSSIPTESCCPGWQAPVKSVPSKMFPQLLLTAIE
jgi:hypothetical protein